MERIVISIRIEKRLNLDGDDIMAETIGYEEILANIDKVPELLYDIFRKFRTLLVNSLLNPFSFLGENK